MTNLSKSSLTTHVGLVFALMLALALEGGWQSAQAQSINQRQTTALALIAGSHRLYDGSFAATGTSSVCGEIPKEASMTGVATFVIEFPSDAINEPLQSIAFGSNELVGGVTKASVFRLNVHVKTADGGTPPGYVLNTDDGKPKNVGTATLTNKAGVTTLKVVGQNDMGETNDLTVTCR
jgi:hypothetical protein